MKEELHPKKQQAPQDVSLVIVCRVLRWLEDHYSGNFVQALGYTQNNLSIPRLPYRKVRRLVEQVNMILQLREADHRVWFDQPHNEIRLHLLEFTSP